jgi:hypothetical protein
MKEYDVIAISLGSAMNILSAMIQSDPAIRVAVIDKDEPSCGQAYPTSEGKFCSCSEMYQILARIFGRKRPVVIIPKQLAKALVYPVHLAETVRGG